MLGGRASRARFDAFLANWETILSHRVDQAVDAFKEIDGVRGLVLAGSHGRGEPWPLSDIDLLPIYDDSLVEHAQAEIERQRTVLLAQWVDQGWGTGLDIGRLIFTRNELARVLIPEGPDVTTILQDDRWYYSLDKGYRGRAIYDPEGLTIPLVTWLTEHRHSKPAVQLRLTRAQREIEEAQQLCIANVDGGDAPGATVALRSAAKWMMTWQLESWGASDTSQGRIGTRFERLARDHDREDLVDVLRDLNDLSDVSVERRMEVAPDWVWERHDRSFRARQHVGEDVTAIQDARDTLRVCSLYEIRRVSEPPYAAWLAIPTEPRSMQDKATQLSMAIKRWVSDNSDQTG